MAETQYFKSSLFAQQMEDTWTGTVRFNSEQSLSESQKAQARENIGAVPFGSNLKILGHFDTIAELQTSAPQNVGDAYSVGTATPYNLYIFDGLRNEWVDYGQIRAADISARYVENQTISVSAWTEDNTILAGFNYKAQIAISGATENDFPIVAFDQSDAVSGNFAALSFSFDGYIEVLAKTKPTAAIIIPVATIISNGGNGRGITNATGGITAGSIKTDDLADGSVVASKIGNKEVARAKLANDALYSPLAPFSRNRDIALTDLGKTLWPQWGDAAATFTLSLTADNSSALPDGFEVAILYMFSKRKVNLSFSGVRMLHEGDGMMLIGGSEVKTLTLPEQGNMIALKKFETNSAAGDLWVMTGPAEVV